MMLRRRSWRRPADVHAAVPEDRRSVYCTAKNGIESKHCPFYLDHYLLVHGREHASH